MIILRALFDFLVVLAIVVLSFKTLQNALEIRELDAAVQFVRHYSD